MIDKKALGRTLAVAGFTGNVDLFLLAYEGFVFASEQDWQDGYDQGVKNGDQNPAGDAYCAETTYTKNA